jgi:hypothetical protein
MIYLGSYAGPFYGIPLSQAEMAGGSQPLTDWSFWTNMLLVMLGTAFLARLVHRRALKK